MTLLNASQILLLPIVFDHNHPFASLNDGVFLKDVIVLSKFIFIFISVVLSTYFERVSLSVVSFLIKLL